MKFRIVSCEHALVVHARAEDADFDDGDGSRSEGSSDWWIERQALKFTPLFGPQLLHAAILFDDRGPHAHGGDEPIANALAVRMSALRYAL